jgi:D-sedoheptulose 7-phosphate isomerase
MPKMNNITKSFLVDQLKCIEKLSKHEDQIEKIINLLIKKRDAGNKIFTVGNGGSASTASHFVSDLLKTSITKKNKRFKAISLVDNLPVILAWANDTSYDGIFEEQLKNLISKNDVVIAFSGSGKSENVVKALRFAKKNGAICIGFTGMHGGYFPKLCDICCAVPSNNMLIIESTHVILCHCIVDAIRNLGKPLFQYE